MSLVLERWIDTERAAMFVCPRPPRQGLFTVVIRLLDLDLVRASALPSTLQRASSASSAGLRFREERLHHGLERLERRRLDHDRKCARKTERPAQRLRRRARQALEAWSVDDEGKRLGRPALVT